MIDNQCPICELGAAIRPAGDVYKVECKRCAFYWISGTAVAIASKLQRRSRIRISGWICEQFWRGTGVRLLEQDVKRIARLPLPTMAERADQVLMAMAGLQKRLTEETRLEDPTYLAFGYVDDASELLVIVRFLEWREYVDRSGSGALRISPAGYQHLDEMRQWRPDSSQAFVAMWFSSEVGRLYEDGLSVGVAAAGYKPVRVDQVEHTAKIDDEIIAQIRRSKFIVADFTGGRGGVYFETGVAFGLDLPIVWTCRADHIDALHFDVRQFNCLLWKPDDLADLARRLQFRIEAVLGRGPIEAAG